MELSRFREIIPSVLLKNPPYRPMPGEPVSGLIETGKGVMVRYALWRLSASSRKGTVIVLQGRSEYIEKQYELISDLLDNGHDVLSFDWRGQGGSSRLLENKKAGYVDDFDEYVEDLTEILQQIALPDCKGPFYILGHSTGSLVALLAAPQIANQITRMVLCSPFLGIGRQPISPYAVKLLAGALAAFGLGEVYLTGRTTEAPTWNEATNIHTSSEEHYKQNRKFSSEFPDLCIGGATASWVFAACKAFERIKDPDFCAQITTPLLIINAGSDVVVNNRESELLVRKLRSGSFLTIEGARHEIWQEKAYLREQFMAAFKAFVPGSDHGKP
ncbi:MAG: alpha/beta hydrolase [Pseudomonadota bacterium]